MERVKPIMLKIWDLTNVPLMYISSAALAAIQQWLGLIAMSVTIGFTCWKWYYEILQKVKEKRKLQDIINRRRTRNKLRNEG